MEGFVHQQRMLEVHHFQLSHLVFFISFKLFDTVQPMRGKTSSTQAVSL